VANPADGSLVASVISSTPHDIVQCVRQAQIVFEQGTWSQSSVQHRATVLSRLARLLEGQIKGYAELETLQTGRTIREMQTQLGRLPEWLYVSITLRIDFNSSIPLRDYFSALIRTRQGFVAPTIGKLHNFVQRVPLGVVAQITVSNYWYGVPLLTHDSHSTTPYSLL
jgi:acyl-CoA reductase-like NAD-dependent aldehyde dehydrogenase